MTMYDIQTHTQNESIKRKYKAEFKALLGDSVMADDGGAFEKISCDTNIRKIVMPLVAEEIKKVYEGILEINPDGSLWSVNMPGLLTMLQRGKTLHLVDLLSAMITSRIVPERISDFLVS